MKICVLTRTTTNHSLGGMEDHIHTLCAGIAKEGHKVHIITTAHPQGKEYKNKDGVEIFFIKGTKSGAYTNAWWKKSVQKFEEMHKKENYDLIHSQSAGAFSLLKNNLGKKHGIPIIASFHGTSYDEYKTRLNVIRHLKAKVGFFESLKTSGERRGDKITALICQKADIVIATSFEQAEILHGVFGAPKDRLAVVFNGMNLDLFSPAPPDENLKQKLGIKPGEKIILCLAKLNVDKGVQFSVESLPKILQRNSQVKLVLVGDGDHRKAIEQKVKKYNLGEKVVFAGFINFDDIPKYMNMANVFVNYTIRQNGYDLTMVEAMACGLPVIASEIGSHPTLIKNGENGFLVPLWDIDALADKIIEVVENRDLMKRIGEKARQTVLADFSDKSMVKKTIEVYNKVLGEMAHV